MQGKGIYIVGVFIEKAMSAIIQALTLDGFVVLADGRSTPMNREEKPNDETQKIFDVSSVSGPLCMVTVGSSEIETADGLMDITKEFTDSANNLRTIEVVDLQEYGNRLACPVYSCLTPHAKNMKAMEGHDLFNVFVHGFINGKPSALRIRLFFQDGSLAEPEIISPEITWRPYIHGADKLAKSMFMGNWPTPPTYNGPMGSIMSVTDVTAMACAYIDACGEEHSIKAEPFCATIGGHIHGAVVSPDGFRWILGYEPCDTLALR